MIKTKIIILFLVLTAFVGKGQTTGFYWNNLNQTSNRLQGKLTGEIYYLNAAEGKYHFYHDRWYEGTIVLTDGDVYKNMRLRYMSFRDKLVAYNDANRALFIVDKDIVDTFYIDSENVKQTFVRLKSDISPKGNHYYEVLYSGTRSLLVYHIIKEKKTRPYKNELGILSDIEYEQDREYYLYSEATGFERVRMGRQSFYSIFPEHKKEIKRILRKNKVIFKDEWAIIKSVTELDKAGILD